MLEYWRILELFNTKCTYRGRRSQNIYMLYFYVSVCALNINNCLKVHVMVLVCLLYDLCLTS